MDESKDKHGIGHPMDRSPADMETDDCSTAPDAQQQTPAKDSSATDPCEQKPKLGIPDPKPTAQRPLTPDELAERKEEEEAELQSKFEEEQAELEARGVWHVPRALRTVLVCSAVVVTAVLGLLLTVQITQFAVEVSRLPPWARWVTTSGIVLFGLVIAFLMLALVWMVFRLSISPRVNVNALRVLQERHRLQRLAAKQQLDVRQEFEEYLTNYPVTRRDCKRLQAMGLTDDEWKSLISARRRLLESDQPTSGGDWLHDFGAGFQSVLDKLADRRIRKYAFRVGTRTAASPIAILDQIIVLYSCIAMVKDLLTIYNLRPAFGQTFLLLSRSILLTYLGGKLGDMSEEGVEWATEELSGAASEWLSAGVGTVGKAVTARVGAKAAEAAVNGLLVRRLGKKTKALLRPARLK